MRLLLATEDKNLRLAVYLVLSEYPGVDVIGTSNDSASLIALSSTACPDIVLMDYKLGGTSAKSTLKKLKDCDNPAHVIILGRDFRERESALQAGADQFVLKGSAPQELMYAISAV